MDRLDKIHGLTIEAALGTKIVRSNGSGSTCTMGDLTYDYKHQWITVIGSTTSVNQPAVTAEEAADSSTRRAQKRRSAQRKSPASEGFSFNVLFDIPATYSGESTSSLKQHLINQYETAILSGKINHQHILSLSQAISMIVVKDLRWNKFLGTKDDHGVIQQASITIWRVC